MVICTRPLGGNTCVSFQLCQETDRLGCTLDSSRELLKFPVPRLNLILINSSL